VANAAAAPRERGRDNLFDFLRLFAALAVVVSHATEHLNVSFLWHTPKGHWWFYDGVPLFFILSGMLVYRSGQRCVETGRPIRQFFANRFLRVAPAIYAYAVVAALLLPAIGAIPWSSLRTAPFVAWFVGNLALLPVYHPSTFRGFGVGVLNGSLWTIPAEVSFYLGVPLLLAMERRLGFRAMVCGVAAVGLAGMALAASTVALTPEPMWRKLFAVSCAPYLFFFGIGIFWNRYWPRAPQHGGLAVLAAALYLALRYSTAAEATLGSVWEAAWALPLGYLVVWVGYHGPRWVGRLTRHGDLSFGVYIWHMVVVNVALYYGLPARLVGVPGTLIVALVMLATLALATISWRVVERPALQAKPFTSW
jgi:peptidoglycan/LPS O-acetylase OafA/YrhL